MSAAVTVQVRRLPHGEGLDLPAYQTQGAAGADVLAALHADEAVTLAPGARALVPTGLELAIPEGFEIQIRPRSGLAARHGVTLVNAPGTIDADYRGEVKVILCNLGTNDFVIRRGERIAQMVLAPVTRIAWDLTTTLDETVRGRGGFGSTGTAAPHKTEG